MMNKKKVLTSLVLGTAVASQVAMPVFAKEQKNDTPTTGTGTWTDDAHTTIGITEVNDKDLIDGSIDKTLNVSFEVPLYVTTAAVGNDADLKTPTKYDIKNTGNRGIVVSGMQIQKLGTWDTVTDESTINTDKTKVKLSIGNCVLSATNGSTDKVKVDIAKQGNAESIFDKGEQYKVIEKGLTLSASRANSDTALNTLKDSVKSKDGIKIAGTIAKVSRTNSGAAAQFRVTYTVSAITADADGKLDQNKGLVGANDVITGAVYVGDDKQAAGLSK